MAYILSVNADILSSTGGPCKCTTDTCNNDPEYQACKNDVRRAYIVSTAAAACLSSGLMGIVANMPLGLAPGLGVNAYFANTIVGHDGNGIVSYSKALAVVWLEGWIFFVLSLFGVRQWLARVLPNSLKYSTGAGIGLYLAFIGMGPSGLGIVGLDLNDIVGLGGCPVEYQDRSQDGDLSLHCLSHVLQNPRVWVGVFLGGVLMAMLLLYRVRGAMIIGILLVSASSWPRGTNAVTQFPPTPDGDDNWHFFKKVAMWRSIHPLGPQNIDWQGYNTGHAWLALISFLYIDLLDTTGTLYAMAMQAGLVDARTGDFEGSSTAYMCDALAISCGSLLGCSPCTAFVESASGIAEGGRTGLTGLTVSFFFFWSLFFAPIFSSFPPWATGSVLVLVGSMMMSSSRDVNWSYMGDAIPAFLTIMGIPFMYSIAYGLIAGIISYMILNIVPWIIIKLTKGRVYPPGWYTDRDPWGSTPQRLVSKDLETKKLSRFQQWAVESSVLPPWMKKLSTGNVRFWELTREETEDYLEGRRATERRVREREEEHRRQREDVHRLRKPDRDIPLVFDGPEAEKISVRNL
ncbi:hypothetical protein MVES1_002425 [Malassezia vespertilionis]|nr:uncharacterized protein MVES1_002425 [Malassezia vespertilionis]WFD07069.1 hypothetical protein MVES1_002425 [Malassezia vespertilionis]